MQGRAGSPYWYYARQVRPTTDTAQVAGVNYSVLPADTAVAPTSSARRGAVVLQAVPVQLDVPPSSSPPPDASRSSHSWLVTGVVLQRVRGSTSTSRTRALTPSRPRLCSGAPIPASLRSSAVTVQSLAPSRSRRPATRRNQIRRATLGTTKRACQPSRPPIARW